MTWSEALEPNSSSPSLDMMPREQVSRLRPARISAQIIAIGVRESVLPPMPTLSPSLTSMAASSSDITFSRRLRSRATVFRRSSRYPSLTPLPSRCLVRPIDASLGVELLDQRVPARQRRLQSAPEARVAPSVEIREGHALLLDPGVVAKIEDPLAVDARELEHVGVADRLQMSAEAPPRIDLADPAGITRRRVFLALAAIHGGAVGRHRNDRVLVTEIEPLCRLDRRQHVGDAREAETVETLDQRGIEMAAGRKKFLPRLAVEQQVERVGAAVGYAHDHVGIHDVVDEGNV